MGELIPSGPRGRIGCLTDLAVDTLFGDLDNDWFLVDDPSEVADPAVGETITDLL